MNVKKVKKTAEKYRNITRCRVKRIAEMQSFGRTLFLEAATRGLALKACSFIKKETLAQVSSCEFYKNFKNTTGSCFYLFEYNDLKKHIKADILQKLEKKWRKMTIEFTWAVTQIQRSLWTLCQLSEKFHWIILVVLDMLWSACGTW